ncbi:hypothetical protein [Gordonia hankookensis]|uniref:Uncharacterized protein n=1 Tax=Gordonia hankookensis TaxID=589403 RepID=A0ABR7W722_9ACTN|nr:hypothetical protein [Gordonia hankookensis]MBD1318625.1 hypothetical protein [Gordonia hankookensis]NDZ94148.1 hypothetical protein [Streptomyces sp. SID11726]NEB25202.1 hypothetical protein [Streptomyces sp. SID6673]
MVKRSDRVDDLEAALAATAVFVDDPDDQGWMTAHVGRQDLFVRIGDFPDEDLWSLWLGDGRWMDFTVTPAGWTLRVPGRRWPAGARPRLPKNEFHD